MRAWTWHYLSATAVWCPKVPLGGPPEAFCGGLCGRVGFWKSGDWERCGYSGRYFGVGLSAVAWGVLSRGARAEAGAGVFVAAGELGRDQRVVLFAAAAGELSALAGERAGRLRLLAQGRPVHHAHEAAARRRHRARQLLRLRPARPRPDTRPDPLADPGQPALRGRRGRPVPGSTPPYYGRGRSACREARRAPRRSRPHRNRCRSPAPARDGGHATPVSPIPPSPSYFASTAWPA